MGSKIADAGKRLSKTDIAAVCAFVLLAGALLFTARYAWISEDEYFYYAIARRVANGDRLLGDEWSFIQLTSLFHLPFCSLFVAVTGGVDGIVLFMRGLFIAADLAVFWYCYLKLRGKGACAVLAAFLFCAHPLAGVLALNYYNICLFAFVILLLTALYPKKPLSRSKTLFCGAAFAAAVVCEPILAAVYPLFCVPALTARIRRQKTDGPQTAPLVPRRFLLWFTAGGGAVGAALLAFLCVTTGPGKILETLPLMFRTNPYHTPLGQLVREKLSYLTEKYGVVNSVLLPLSAVAAAAVGTVCKQMKNGRYLRLCAFLVSSATVVSCYVRVARNTDVVNGLEAFFRAGAFPAFCFAPVGLRLCKKTDRRLSVFWMAALIFSLPMDLTSNFTLLACGTLAYFPAVCAAGVFLRELREDFSAGRDNRRFGKTAFRAALAAACAVLLCECAALAAQLDLSLVKNRLSDAPVVVSDTGPGKGVCEPADRVKRAAAIQRDLERIRAVSDGPFYAVHESAYCYLTADLRVASYMPLYHDDDLNGRVLEYWNDRPENRPAYIYIVSLNVDERAVLRTVRQIGALCVGEPERGEAGYLIEVKRWK
ncbi:MAG: hypothetical protein IJL26_00350 [Clostridia bacterium]|nr:hypothetical protein [Clostridia bacterium]